MARPRLKIDPEKIRMMARLGVKNQDIARILDVGHQTLTRRFGKQIALGHSEQRCKLLSWAFKSAEQGNVQMQIFLLKNRCGMTEKTEIEQDVSGKITLEAKEQINSLWARVEQLAKLKEEWSAKQVEPVVSPAKLLAQ